MNIRDESVVEDVQLISLNAENLIIKKKEAIFCSHVKVSTL